MRYSILHRVKTPLQRKAILYRHYTIALNGPDRIAADLRLPKPDSRLFYSSRNPFHFLYFLRERSAISLSQPKGRFSAKADDEISSIFIN